MTSKLKCPFCGQHLRQSKHQEPYTGQNPYFCDTHDCYPSECCVGTKELWQALIQAKQDLKIAREALKPFADRNNWDFEHCFVDNPQLLAGTALEQIEHKDENNE